ncbi:hypothetical protein [Streptococcus sp. DD13]|uniref:hypothetical protein n=1 Tax=Streptococcus sp. DD13 TaxID=1777881 RepID=UPI000798890E|nr:hypothetical protein [Streptococcus sp. DD13]KXT78416.1 hypothetical protein STRDD13_00719 [Streptococcus sp. DD13]
MKQKKKWLFVSLFILMLGGIGMVILNAVRHKSEQEQQRNLETSIAKMLVNDYEGIDQIEFNGWSQSPETGTWHTTIILNRENRISINFRSLSGLNEISGGRYNSGTFHLTKKVEADEFSPVGKRIDEIENISLDGINIIYSSEKGK